MSFTYQQRKRAQGTQNLEPKAAPGPGMDALMNGQAQPTAAQKGRPFDLDAAMKAKMEHAFGDLSAVKFYESQAVGDAGAEAIARGNEIAFAPGMANFSTRSGQERLGHELSHVMSQRSGQVRGEGFLASSALEARADREGAMAAAGEQVYTGPVTHALSDASPAPSAAGPMQAKRDDSEPSSRLQPEMIYEKPTWKDVKWGFGTRRKYARAQKNTLDLSNKKDDIIRREGIDMAQTDMGTNDDSFYIPNPKDEDDVGYEMDDIPGMSAHEEKKKKWWQFWK